MSKRLDLVGQRFGRLTVISLNEEATKQKKNTQWNCKCDCGNEKVVDGRKLKNGSTISCGCYKKDKTRERWQDEGFRQKQSEASSKRLKKRWEDEEYRRKQIEVSSKWLKKQWEDEEFRQMQSEQRKRMNEEMWQNKEFRQMRSNQMSRESHPNWKGGITSISTHLRQLPVVQQWFDDSKKQVNYTCELTGKVGVKLHTHHLKAFSTIVLEAHELHNIQIHETIGDYTEEELHKLEEYIVSWHKDSSNAVVLSEEVHMLFHKAKDKGGYGQGNNTPEQYEEFKQRYLNGEFEGLI